MNTMDFMTHIDTYIDGRKEDMIRTLQSVVNIDSGAYNIEGVNKVADIYKEMLAALGFSLETLPGTKYAPHVLAVKKGTGGKRILIACHMDTVFDDGAARERPFTIRDGKAYGPGVLDMKGGTVAALYALCALEDAGFHDYESLSVLLTSDEERGSETSEEYIIEQGKVTDVALIPESGRLGDKLVTSRKGGGIFNLDIYGKASHAGNAPRDGIHAIDEMFHKGIALHALTDYEKGRTVSVGVIRAGTRSNIIPEHAFAEIDIRCSMDADGQKLMEEMQEISDHAFVEGTKSELTKVMYRPPMERTPENQWLFGIAQKCAKTLGFEVEEVSVGGGSDGNYLSALGVATLDALGPIGEFAHSDREYMVVDSLYQRSKLIAAIIGTINDN